jgi:Tfp pilus assembly protein PilO
MTKIRQWSILTVVAVLVVFAAGWFLLVKPQHAKSASLRSQAATQQESNQLLLTQIASLQVEQKSLPQQQQALQKFTTQVPNDASEPTIIRQLTAAAAGAGVDLVSMTPGTAAAVVSATVATAPVPAATPTAGATTTTPAAGATSLVPSAATTGQLVQLPITIGVTGSFPNVESFFQSLEKLPRALMVTSWSMCPDATETGAAAPTGGGATCTVPATPSNKTLPTGTLGATLSAVVFYAPPVATATTPTAATTAPAN